MQPRQFDNLMEGKKALSMYISGLSKEEEARFQKALEINDTKIINKIVEDNQKPITHEFKLEVDKYIENLRGNKVKERTIRRKVKAKFGILVVPK